MRQHLSAAQVGEDVAIGDDGEQVACSVGKTRTVAGGRFLSDLPCFFSAKLQSVL